MNTLIQLLPTVEMMVLGICAGALLALCVPTSKRQKAEAEAAGRAAAEKVIVELATAYGRTRAEDIAADLREQGIHFNGDVR